MGKANAYPILLPARRLRDFLAKLRVVGIGIAAGIERLAGVSKQIIASMRGT
jgi:hypothetical protein